MFIRSSRGKKIFLVRDKILGMYDDSLNEITVDDQIRGKELLDTTIHEVLHLELPKLHENYVRKIAKVVAEAVHKVLRDENKRRKRGKR